jgi:hypothetical protein
VRNARRLPSRALRGARLHAPPAWLRLVLTAVLPALLAACSATGSGPASDRLLVRLYEVHVATAGQVHIGPPVDAHHEVRLELSNQPDSEGADGHSKEQHDADLKVASDELMGELIADLDKLGFQKLSARGEPPAAGTRGWVQVLKDGASRTFAVPETGPTAEQLQTFVYMKLAVNDFYMRVSGLQYIENPKGAELLKGSQSRGGK